MNRIDDFLQAAIHRQAHIFRADFNSFIHTCISITTGHSGNTDILFRNSGADGDFQVLSRSFVDDKLFVALKVIDDRIINSMSTDANCLAVYDISKSYHGYFRRATTHVDDHIAFSRFHIQARANGCGHRLINQEHFTSTSCSTRLNNGLLFYFSHTVRKRNHYTWTFECRFYAGLTQEVLQHHF
ncbi:hypothetical protein D3C72_894220 [compost metagenome]